jgi:biotin-(acetyl-CoA carboxylase) ligase
MTLRLGDDMIGGAFAGLGTDGSLLLETDGVVRTFTAGEILQ